MFEQKKEVRKVRRLYSFNYDDLGYLVGVSGKAVREWMSRRGLKLDGEKYAQNLDVVNQFLNDRRGVSRESLVQRKKWDAFTPDISRVPAGVVITSHKNKPSDRTNSIPCEHGVMKGDYGGAKIEPVTETTETMETTEIASIVSVTPEDAKQAKLAELRLATDSILSGGNSLSHTRTRAEIAAERKGNEDRIRVLGQIIKDGDSSIGEQEEYSLLVAWFGEMGIAVGL